MDRLRTWQLFALATVIWGTTWHAILYQIEHTTPEAGVALRFTLAGLCVLAWRSWRGESMRFAWRAHLWFAVPGTLMFSLSYLCVYYAESHVPSGLVAVGYAAAPLVNGIGAWLLWRTALGPRFLVGGVLGVTGVTLIFWPEFAQASSATALGAALTVAAVALSAAGNLVIVGNPKRGLGMWPTLGWGMVYGGALSALFVLASGQSFEWPTQPAWWLSLVYLSMAGSVVAFACFLTLQQRLGPGKASTVGVMTPMVALAMSAAFEGYVPGWATAAGIALAIAGNVLMLRR